ncbi:MAG: CRTAC1 family protein [bacterium]|nr:CRTAC1 family protein [Planctomycetota bacterium]HIL51561.1 CRTAC1 family protein [Planctomycetota bacterium]
MCSSHQRRETWLPIVSGLLLLGACSESPPRDSPPAQPAEPAPLAVRRIGGRGQDLPPWSAEFRAALEPRKSESSEAAAHAIEESLARWIEGLFAGDSPGGATESGLFPVSLDLRFDDGNTRVLRVAANARVPSESHLRERLKQAPWDAFQGPRAQVRVERIESLRSGGFRATVRVRLVAHSGPASAQLNASWRGTWSGESEPALLSLEGLDHEVLQNRQPWFDEISMDVFGGLDFWEDELALGCEDYHRRTDQRVNFFYAGILGIALGDANGDGLEDLYLSQVGGLPGRLFLHQPDHTVLDGSRAAGLDFLDTTRGALFVDLDGDGDQDLCLAREEDLVLCWNDGTGKFSRRTWLKGQGSSPVYSISAADADCDGDLDLYGCRYPSSQISGGVPTPYHDAKNGVANVYWRNEGDGKFSEVAREVGLTVADERFSYVSIWEDLDHDGDLDLYVVNDYGANHAFLNEGGTFREAAGELGLTDAAAGMGISVADSDGDGDLDILVSNMFSQVGRRVVEALDYRADGSAAVRAMHRQHAAGNALLTFNGSTYERSAEAAGCAPGGWAWGAVFADWNADGLADMYVPNGFISGQEMADVESLFWRRVVESTPDVFGPAEEYRRGWAAVGHFSQYGPLSWNGHERNYAYLNLGSGEFADASGLARADFLDDSRSALRLDWDGDGLLDLLLVNRSGPRLRLLRGLGGGETVAIELVANGAPAVGAKVTLTLEDGRRLVQRVYAGEGLLAQSSPRLIFGLGPNPGLLAVEVDWGAGQKAQFAGLAAGRLWRITLGEPEAKEHGFAPSPFEGRAPTPARAGEGGAPRTILADKMPLGRWSLPRPDGGRAFLSEFAGAPLLLCFYSSSSATSRSFFADLAGARAELRKAGGRIIPVELESAAAFPALENWDPANLDFGQRGLRAAKNDEQILQALLIEILGSYPDLDLPLCLLCDSNSNLVAIYYASQEGSQRTSKILADIRQVRYMNPEDPGTTSLSRGRWLKRPTRRLAELAPVLQMLGARELARVFAERAQAGGGGR